MPGLNSILNSIYQASSIFNVENNQQFLFFLGVMVFIILVTSLSFKAFTTYVQVRYIEMCNYSICKRLTERYMYQPYSWFLNRHSSDLGTTILSEVSSGPVTSLKSLIDLTAKSMVSIALIVLLIVADPQLAFIVGITIVGAYGLFFYFLRK